MEYGQFDAEQFRRRLTLKLRVAS